MNIKSLLLASSMALTIGLGAPNIANAQKLMTKEDVQKIVADYIQENPEAILDSFENFHKKKRIETMQKAQENISKNMDALTSADTPSIGAEDADVIVVEFFDYNCGYCKRALPDINELIENDKKVRVYFKEMPILSPASEQAAKWALAAHKQGKYFEYHSALMESRAEKSVATLEKIGKDLKLNVKKLKADANSSAISAQLKKDVALAREIGVQGTPAFIINDTFKPGYLGPDGLERAVKQARASK